MISGGRTIEGWNQVNGTNIWQAKLSRRLKRLQTRQLYVNGVRAMRARSNGGLVGALIAGEGYTTTDTSMQNWGNPSDIEFVYNVAWTQQRCSVANISITKIAMKQPCFNNASKYNSALINTPTYIENAYELLQQPGQWYLNRSTSTIYYIPRPGEDMKTATVVAPVLETLVSGTGTLDNPIHNIVFKGLTFAYSTWLRPNDNNGFVEVQANFTFTPDNQTNVIKTPGNVVFHSAQNMRFERNTFTHLGSIGLDLDSASQNNVIIGNVFTDISGSGVQIGNVDNPKPSDTRSRDTGNQLRDEWHEDKREGGLKRKSTGSTTCLWDSSALSLT